MDKLSSLWQGASYQDNLLQTYRNFHLTTQSIFIAIGAGLSVVTLSCETLFKILVCYGLLTVITCLGFYLLRKMKGLIRARAEDVSYFHRQIIEFEKALPKEDRVLTAFKVNQKFNRENVDVNSYFRDFELTEKTIDDLVERGLGHTRRLLDKNLFIWFYGVWISFHVLALLSMIVLILKQ